MFKFERDQPFPVPVTAVAPPASGRPRFDRRALLAWGEHCVECAAPACYQSCDLYSPTPGGSCRRFEHGIVRNMGAGTPAAEIRFRRWGKLEAQGNAKLLPASGVSAAEKVLALAWSPANQLGRLMARALRDQRWRNVMEVLHKHLNTRLRISGRGDPLPDMFIAEITNPTDTSAELSLTFYINRPLLARAVTADQLPPPVVRAITAVPGFSRHELPAAELRDILESGLPFNISLTPVGDVTPHLVFHTLDLVSRADHAGAVPAAALPAAAAKAKCVVFDLDNTLWEGVLLEGTVKLRPGIAELFRTLDERGILISVASKNAHDDALAQLKAFGIDDYLLYPMVGWRPKSESIRRLVKALDIGMDTIIFIDDNPFERAEVAEACPGIAVLPETEIAALAGHPRLQGATTAESRQRRKMYQQAILREEAASAYDGDYFAFLRGCDIRVEIRPDRPEDFDRVVELVQRTNQLNFSGRKYSRDDISAILRDASRGRHVVSVSDKFGSYGTVGFCLSHQDGDTVHVDDFMLSCRVQGKFIEQALFWYLTHSARPRARMIQVNFRRTDRNRAAEMVMEKLDFVPAEGGGQTHEVTEGTFATDFLRINEPEPVAA